VSAKLQHTGFNFFMASAMLRTHADKKIKLLG